MYRALAVCWLLLGLHSVQSAEMPDLARLVRPPSKEPKYVSNRPLYGLLAFGPKADKAIWLVLDKSKADREGYDVLYLDRDATGDLTGDGKELRLGTDGRFRLPELVDPSTRVRHKDFSLRPDGADPTVMVGVRWRGEFRLGGGYPQDPSEGYMRFATRPADAPVVWLQGDGPFRFQHWCSGKLEIGGASDFKVFLGQPGRGKNAFGATQEHILPGGEWVRATLVYRDGMGKEKNLGCELRERC